jgi:hypothetical protein
MYQAAFLTVTNTVREVDGARKTGGKALQRAFLRFGVKNRRDKV